MAIELTRARALPKPWGVADLRPWSGGHDGQMVGEIWYERPGAAASEPSLLLKLLFTSQPLSIQVHPDDAYAQAMGQSCGKTEAWYVLSAAPGAKVALGLKQRIAPKHLRKAVDDGSIVGLVAWQPVAVGEAIFVPAGTIHAIGAGLVIAEIQQRSDATFRMFDFGRKRELHAESAIAVADAGPADPQVEPSRLTDERTLLGSNPHFAFERVVLPPGSAWCLEAERETWLLVVSGRAQAGSFKVATGNAIFAQSDRVDIHAGSDGMTGLVAYAGAGPVPHLLRHLAQPGSLGVREPEPGPTSLSRAKVAPVHGPPGKMQ